MKTVKTKRSIDRKLRLSLLQAAEEFGVSRETIRRSLAAENIKRGADGKQSIREYHAALSGDARASRGRLTLARAKLAELELREKERDLIPREEVAQFILETFRPLREFMVSMPGNIAALVNPTDPEHARQHLIRFRDEFLKLREKVPLKKES